MLWVLVDCEEKLNIAGVTCDRMYSFPSGEWGGGAGQVLLTTLSSDTPLQGRHLHTVEDTVVSLVQTEFHLFLCK